MFAQRTVRPALLVLLLAGIATIFSGGLSTARAADPQPSAAAGQQPSTGGDDAVAALGRMTKTLAAKQFSFSSHTLRAYAGPNGELLHIAHTTKTVFNRPDHLSVDVDGDDGESKLFYDGKNLVIYSVEQKKYVSLPVAGGIGKALDEVEDRTRMDFPLADLLGDDPGKSLLAGVTSGGQVGTATIDGTPCRHFFFVQASEDLEWELWLEDNDKSLPRRVAITYRSQPGRPMFLAELSNWNFNIQVADSDFEFKPPAGVVKVELSATAGPPAAPSK
jgi:hypothetical protein